MRRLYSQVDPLEQSHRARDAQFDSPGDVSVGMASGVVPLQIPPQCLRVSRLELHRSPGSTGFVEVSPRDSEGVFTGY
jgi:hypothetical protein